MEAFLEQWGAKQGSGCHVATSPRRDVPTSRSWVNNAEVNNQKRRDVPTSRRLNIATLQRRDVSMGSALHHLKHEWFGMGGYREAYERGHEIPEQSDANLEEVPVICTVSHFWILE